MLRNQGRIAGAGITYDRYDEESDAGAHQVGGYRNYSVAVRLPRYRAEELAALSGPCVTVVPAKEVIGR